MISRIQRGRVDNQVSMMCLINPEDVVPGHLMRKRYGKEAKFSYFGCILMENRNGLVARLRIEKATGYAERDAAFDMLESLGGTKRITATADRSYVCLGLLSAMPRHPRDTTRRSKYLQAIQHR